MTVHFNVHMDPAKGETMPEELTDVILGEILYAQNNTDAVLSDVVIDEESLDIQGKTGNGSPRSLQPTQSPTSVNVGACICHMVTMIMGNT